MTKWEDEAGQWRLLGLMIYENFVLIKFGRSAEASSHFMPSHGEGRRCGGGRQNREEACFTLQFIIRHISFIKTNQFQHQYERNMCRGAWEGFVIQSFPRSLEVGQWTQCREPSERCRAALKNNRYTNDISM
jgi:hypothetical protein